MNLLQKIYNTHPTTYCRALWPCNAYRTKTSSHATWANMADCQAPVEWRCALGCPARRHPLTGTNDPTCPRPGCHLGGSGFKMMSWQLSIHSQSRLCFCFYMKATSRTKSKSFGAEWQPSGSLPHSTRCSLTDQRPILSARYIMWNNMEQYETNSKCRNVILAGRLLKMTRDTNNWNFNTLCQCRKWSTSDSKTSMPQTKPRNLFSHYLRQWPRSDLETLVQILILNDLKRSHENAKSMGIVG